eukprot:CAMPEP_0170328886 /NCGR_PEP_ID=MMETSP0116_2-20130129/65358_1 /TAXON_ID=400756 /ORGANISM="Durinskia baltica, Strain CSIRO CS-38" /LENGTH=285 /DNA_ID=CAMNT_0010582019 /DNA_START=100 /DNA_END=954 /DNA_ORIENTATION=+
MEDPRLGLSIDSETASCASDLSDSQASWEDYGSPDDDPSILLLPAMDGYLPRTPSFRSRALRRGEEDEYETNNNDAQPLVLPQQQQQQTPRRRRETASSWDDDTRIAQHPRAPSLRFCLTLCTLTLVLLSLRGNGVSKTGFQQGDFRRAERVIDSENINLDPLPVLNSSTESLPKSHVRSADQQINSAESSKAHAMRTGGTRFRSNMAMAKSGERRPVFGVAPKVDEAVLDPILPIDPKSETRDVNSHWTSWLAAAALIGMLVETGYKEYRLCRTDDFLENERRL